MCAGIANGVQREQPRLEDLCAYLHIARYAPLNVVGRSFEERKHHAEVHDVHERPVGREPVRVAILLLEMLNEQRLRAVVCREAP